MHDFGRFWAIVSLTDRTFECVQKAICFWDLQICCFECFLIFGLVTFALVGVFVTERK